MAEKAMRLPTNPSTSMSGSTIAAGDTPSAGQTVRPDPSIAGRTFAPARLLDPLRSVQGAHARYDCPDIAAVDRHLHHLRRHLAAVRTRSPDLAGPCREDVDRLLDRRAWLTLPIADQH
jgi:hypothetical protein